MVGVCGMEGWAGTGERGGEREAGRLVAAVEDRIITLQVVC
jgi:hypothetical protein